MSMGQHAVRAAREALNARRKGRPDWMLMATPRLVLEAPGVYKAFSVWVDRWIAKGNDPDKMVVDHDFPAKTPWWSQDDRERTRERLLAPLNHVWMPSLFTEEGESGEPESVLFWGRWLLDLSDWTLSRCDGLSADDETLYARLFGWPSHDDWWTAEGLWMTHYWELDTADPTRP